MLSAREVQAFCLAPATAPVAAAVLLGSPSPWPLVAVVAYVAAFALGAPLFILFARRGWPLAAQCLSAAAIAGTIAAVALVTVLLLAFSISRFLASPSTAVFIGVGAAWGIGLGLLAGASLFALLRAKGVAPAPA